MAKATTILEKHGWKAQRELGKGGQAPVYLVEKQGELRAVKFLRSEPGKQAYDRFHQEIEAIKKVNHPSIVKIFEHGKDEPENLHFYVMEYLKDFRPIKEIVGQQDSPFYRNALKSLAIYTRLLEGLQECEKASIVHRDLSLGNILVGPEKEIVKIIDFGCCFIEEGNLITFTDEAVGTPHYRAPECEGFSREKPTSRADLYSAGKILWSLVTNRRAFSREKPVFDNLSLEKVLPADPMTWHLHHVFEKTVRHNPGDRYSSVSESLESAQRVKNVIEGNFLPLEILQTGLCPICGSGKLSPANHLVDQFRNTQTYERLLSSLNDMDRYWAKYQVCPHCGFMSLFAKEIRNLEIDRRKNLQ